MTTRVILTVDTELLARHHAAGLDWEENFCRSYEAAGVGVPYQLALLAKYRLKACFFVDPMPALVCGIDPIRRMIAPILAAGQEVQLHIHPFWQNVADGMEDSPRHELIDYDADDQMTLIARARDLLIEAGAPPPVAFRSGGFSANADTLSALSKLGFAYDASHNGDHHPWPCALPFAPDRVLPFATHDMVEIPVSLVRSGNGLLRHAQLAALSLEEMKALLSHARRENHPLVSIVSHSFELATRDGLRPNKHIRGRFDALCAFLDRNRQSLPTAHIKDLGDLRLDAPGSPLPRKRLREWRRTIQQGWADLRYEHRSLSLNAAGGTSLGAADALVPLAGL